MENTLQLNQFEIEARVNELREANNLEKAIKGNHETFTVTVDENRNNKLTLIFNKAQEKIAKALLHKEVEKDILKAKESFDYATYLA